MSDEILVKVENVSKKFCRDLKKSLWYGIRDIAGEITGHNDYSKDLRPKEFWALDDISFELKRGEVLGLIGRNGAGKTTLLRILNNLIKPNAGRITTRGKVGALIALGAGFNPILTGRGNIYVNGAVLGLPKKEIDAKLGEIVDFAELWDFIDTPVQSYSSGMRVRLGFAVVSTIEPDILLIDEILAVGDRRFQLKCFNHISKLANNTAIMLVSHNMTHISRVCNRVIVFDGGSKIFEGDVQKGISFYDTATEYDTEKFIYTSEGFSLNKFEILEKEITWDGELKFILDFNSEKEIDDSFVRVTVNLIDGSAIAEWRSSVHGIYYSIKKGNNIFEIAVKNVRLSNEKYKVSVSLTKGSGSEYMINAHYTAELLVKDGIYTRSHYLI
jgi:lipopolysaccharide transport system ATP-binding protein